MNICINNQKGGTAKTTTTKELGYLAAQSGIKTLLIDLDPQYSLSKSFGLTHEDVFGNSIYDVLMEEVTAEEVIVSTKYENLYLLPASKDLSMLDVDLALKYQTKSLFNHLKNVLEPIKNDYGMILIDTLPSLGMTALNALCASDWLLIPCIPEEACLTQLEDLLEVSKKTMKLNPDLKYLGILPVMVNKVTTHHKKGLEALSDYYATEYNIKILDSYIGTCTSFRDSVALKDAAGALFYDQAVLNYKKVFKDISKIVGLK